MTGIDGLIVPVVRTALVLVAVFVGLRFLGRRHSAELHLDDILLILLIANSVQNAMTSGSGRLSVAVASAGTLMGVGWLAGAVFRRSATAQRRIDGAPAVLVHDGRIVRRNLRGEHLTDDELAAMLRKQGLENVSDVKLAVLEPNGSFSVITRLEGET